uniref:Uncharacterized protein n=1 Tax=Anguilla anguilla TaxID=7936 RepID=A0A0E9RPZ3_ANGAN
MHCGPFPRSPLPYSSSSLPCLSFRY